MMNAQDITRETLAQHAYGIIDALTRLGVSLDKTLMPGHLDGDASAMTLRGSLNASMTAIQGFISGLASGPIVLPELHDEYADLRDQIGRLQDEITRRENVLRDAGALPDVKAYNSRAAVIAAAQKVVDCYSPDARIGAVSDLRDALANH